MTSDARIYKEFELSSYLNFWKVENCNQRQADSYSMKVAAK